MKGLVLLHPLLLLSLACGFSGTHVVSHRQSSKPLGAAASNLDLEQRSFEANGRRDALASLLLFTSAGVVGTITSHQIPVTSNTRLLGSIEEALSLIESECDRRFLHGVVASGYRFMYKGVPFKDPNFPMVVQSETSDMMGSSDFAALEKDMTDRPIKPSNGQLAFTSPTLVNGVAASIWPLGDNVHFSWSEDGGNLRSSAGKMIVDGVDCGRMSLEDALEGRDREIMFRADQYLAVPISMEAELLAGLQSSFII